MAVIITNVKEYEGKFLVYNRPTKKLSFKGKGLDNKSNLTVGMVRGGEVAGKRVEVWLTKIAKDRKAAKLSS
jgi:hypothetical protein